MFSEKQLYQIQQQCAGVLDELWDLRRRLEESERFRRMDARELKKKDLKIVALNKELSKCNEE